VYADPDHGAGHGSPRGEAGVQGGGNGPLSPASAAAVLQRLQQRGGATGTFERRRAAEAASAGNLLLVGNKVTLRRDGPGEFKAMFAAVKETRDRGNVESCIIEDDEVGNRSADALLA
jgi:cardiolipin synthase